MGTGVLYIIHKLNMGKRFRKSKKSKMFVQVLADSSHLNLKGLLGSWLEKCSVQFLPLMKLVVSPRKAPLVVLERTYSDWQFGEKEMRVYSILGFEVDVDHIQ